MDNHMKLLYNHDKYMKIKSQVGGDYNKFNGGFPNLIKNVEKEKKKEYQYNIDNILETEKINIKNILIKRKEETKPLIDLEEDTKLQLIKRKEEYVTNIDIDDL